MKKENTSTSMGDHFISAAASVTVLSALVVDLGLAFLDAGYKKVTGKENGNHRTLFVSRLMQP